MQKFNHLQVNQSQLTMGAVAPEDERNSLWAMKQTQYKKSQ